jgi:ribosomal protein S27AE
VDIGTIISIVVVVFFAVSACLVAYGTVAKTRWGINLRRVSCPNCGTPMPRVRVPASGREALWGGDVCPKCGCEMDKWGRRLTG